MKLNWRGIGIHLSLPANPTDGIREYPFGLKFLGGKDLPKNTIAVVLCLGWIQVGLRLWPPNAGPKSGQTLDEWAEQLVREKF